MRILITGSDGFIGNRLRVVLEAAGHQVRGMDLRGSDGTRGDVGDFRDCRRFCRDMEIVVHAAAVHQATQVRKHPQAVVDVNVGGTGNLLEAAAAAGVRRFVYLSTAKLYGEPARMPSRESDPLCPLDPYATSKLAAEERCREFHLSHGLEVAMLRPFSVYGAGQDLDTGYVGMLLSAIRNGVDPILPGQPDFLRDFVHVDDLLQLLSDCIQQPLDGITVVNAASGRSHTLRALVDDLSHLSGSPINASFREPSADTIRRSCGDISQAHQLFRYRPQRSLNEGLAECVEWVMNRQNVQHEMPRRSS